MKLICNNKFRINIEHMEVTHYGRQLMKGAPPCKEITSFIIFNC